MKHIISTALLILFLSFSLNAQESTVPQLINYQGKLTDENGKALTGTKKIEFNLYDAAIKGNKLWGPQVFENVPLENGHFNVILGPADIENRSIVDAFSSGNCFIGIKVGKPDADLSGVTEISPRQQILSSPYAILSEQAAKAEYATKAGTAENVNKVNVGECKSVEGACGNGMYKQPTYYLDRVQFSCPDDHPIMKSFKFFRCGAIDTSDEGLAIRATCCKIIQ